MKFYHLALGLLAVWRVTHLLQAEDGPWDVTVRLRSLAGSGFWGKLLDCFCCLSLWISAPFGWWIGETWPERVLLWLSFSGGAILLEKITNRNTDVPPAVFVEEPAEEKTDGMLRTETKSDPGETGAGSAKS